MSMFSARILVLSICRTNTYIFWNIQSYRKVVLYLPKKDTKYESLSWWLFNRLVIYILIFYLLFHKFEHLWLNLLQATLLWGFQVAAATKQLFLYLDFPPAALQVSLSAGPVDAALVATKTTSPWPRQLLPHCRLGWRSLSPHPCISHYLPPIV
jgi:hypothetical protein